MWGRIGRRCMGKRKVVYWILLALIMATVTGCGYTLEEKREIQFQSCAGFFPFSYWKCIRENEVQGDRFFSCDIRAEKEYRRA